MDRVGGRGSGVAARELYSHHGDLTGLANVHRLLGRIAFQKGAYREALDEEMRALDLAQGLNDVRLLGQVCVDIGNTFASLGREVREEAIQWYERAIGRLTEAADWSETARAYLNLAILVGEDRPADALDGLARSREFAERAHEPRSVGRALASGVEMRLALGQVDDAERDNDQARRIFERSEYALGLLRADLNRGVIAERRGQWEDAEQSYTTALGRARTNALDDEIAASQFHLARLWFKTRDLPRAREAYEEAERLRLPERRPNAAPAFRELGSQLRHAVDGGGATAAPGPQAEASGSPTDPGKA